MEIHQKQEAHDDKREADKCRISIAQASGNRQSAKERTDGIAEIEGNLNATAAQHFASF